MTKSKKLDLLSPWEAHYPDGFIKYNSGNYQIAKIEVNHKPFNDEALVTIVNKDDVRDYATLDLRDFKNHQTFFNDQELDGYVPRKEESKPQKYTSYKAVVKVGNQYISELSNDGKIKFTNDKSQALSFEPETIRVYGCGDIVGDFKNFDRAFAIAKNLGGKVIKQKIVKLIYPEEEL